MVCRTCGNITCVHCLRCRTCETSGDCEMCFVAKVRAHDDMAPKKVFSRVTGYDWELLRQERQETCPMTTSTPVKPANLSTSTRPPSPTNLCSACRQIIAFYPIVPLCSTCQDRHQRLNNQSSRTRPDDDRLDMGVRNGATAWNGPQSALGTNTPTTWSYQDPPHCPLNGGGASYSRLARSSDDFDAFSRKLDEQGGPSVTAEDFSLMPKAPKTMGNMKTLSGGWPAAPGSHLPPKSKPEEATWSMNNNNNNNNNNNRAGSRKECAGAEGGEETSPVQPFDWWAFEEKCTSCYNEIVGQAVRRCVDCNHALCAQCYSRNYRRCHLHSDMARLAEQQITSPTQHMNRTVGGPVQSSQANRNQAGGNAGGCCSRVPRGATPRGLLRVRRPTGSNPTDSKGREVVCGHTQSKHSYCTTCDLLLCDDCFKDRHQYCANGHHFLPDYITRTADLATSGVIDITRQYRQILGWGQAPMGASGGSPVGSMATTDNGGSTGVLAQPSAGSLPSVASNGSPIGAAAMTGHGGGFGAMGQSSGGNLSMSGGNMSPSEVGKTLAPAWNTLGGAMRGGNMSPVAGSVAKTGSGGQFGPMSTVALALTANVFRMSTTAGSLPSVASNVSPMGAMGMAGNGGGLGAMGQSSGPSSTLRGGNGSPIGASASLAGNGFGAVGGYVDHSGSPLGAMAMVDPSGDSMLRADGSSPEGAYAMANVSGGSGGMMPMSCGVSSPEGAYMMQGRNPGLPMPANAAGGCGNGGINLAVPAPGGNPPGAISNGGLASPLSPMGAMAAEPQQQQPGANNNNNAPPGVLNLASPPANNPMSRDARLRLQSRLANIQAAGREIQSRHSQESDRISNYFDRMQRQLSEHKEKMMSRLERTLTLRMENLVNQEVELRRRHTNGPGAELEGERTDGLGAFQVWEDSTIEFISPIGETSAAPDPVSQMLAQTRVAFSAYVPHCHVVCPREALVFTGKLFAFQVHLKDHLHNAVALRNGENGPSEMRAWAVVLHRGRPTRELIPATVAPYPTTGHYAVSLQSPRRACELMVHCRLRGQDLPNTPMRWRVEESRDYRRLINASPIHMIGTGEPSNLPGQFNRPWGIACDDRGFIVVSDRANGRIQILRPDFTVERVFGQQGSGDGDLQKPAGVAIHPVNRYIYVVDKDNHRIVVFSWNGDFLFRWGRRGTQRGEFFYPWDIAIDPSGQRLVVTDSRNHRLQFFRVNGDFLYEYHMDSVVMNLPGANNIAAATGRLLDQPRGITFIDQNRLVVTDFQTHRLCIIRLDSNTGSVTYIGGEGSDLGRFVRPQCVASDREGNIVVTESRSGRVQIMDNQMRPQLTFGAPGADPGQFNRPAGVCFTPNRRLVIVDSENHRVIVYSIE